MYPAYHRQHHTYQYGPEQAYPEIQAMARRVNDSLYDYIETLLDPYICGAQLTAADLYLYMISRWNVDKTELRASRPKLAHFIDRIRAHPTIEATLASQPRRK
jgi:glutathione S-transferase